MEEEVLSCFQLIRSALETMQNRRNTLAGKLSCACRLAKDLLDHNIDINCFHQTKQTIHAACGVTAFKDGTQVFLAWKVLEAKVLGSPSGPRNANASLPVRC